MNEKRRASSGYFDRAAADGESGVLVNRGRLGTYTRDNTLDFGYDKLYGQTVETNISFSSAGSSRRASRTSGRRGGSRRRKQRSCASGCLVPLCIIAVIAIVAGFLIHKHTGGDVSRSIDEYMYPIRYEEIVKEYADEFDMDKYLIYAVIRTESNFDQYAVSSAGAYGLMQLQEETAQDCADDLDMEVDLPDDLYDPDINIRLGVYYLDWLLDNYDGNLDYAIAAYNGGIGNVNKWLDSDEYLGEDGELQIPFGETEKYVEGVRDSYEKYKELYK